MAKRQPKKFLKTEVRDGQVSAPGGNLANYFMRNIPLWNPPAWQEADFWRKFVVKQPIAAICRDRIASFLNSLDWQIVPRDSEKRDELKAPIKYYTKLLEKGSSYYNDIDFPTHVEWLTKDLHDLPFGTASEIGRMDDAPKGRVVWIRPLDAGTLAPTLNFDFPIMQQSVGTGLNPVYLPKDFCARVYLSPRTELQREGWGFAPPERIYLAIEMLYRGDSYYAQLLLNTPEAGILDLGDMEKSSAQEWVNGLRDLLYGINPLKMPVLYEHTTDAKFIPFGKPPSEIMYDSITMKYAAIVAAGYGLTLSDIGLSMGGGSGGDTLAGTIRMERVSKSSGFSTAKKKIQAYFNKILPDTLKFNWIDYDDEKNVAKGRARLASSQAADVLVRNKVFKPSEIRQQMLADGLISVNVPEVIDTNDPEFESLQPQFGKPGFGGSRGQQLGNPKEPSGGGQGEIIPQQVVQRNLSSAETGIAKAAYGASDLLLAMLSKVSQNLSPEELSIWEEYVDGYLVGKSDIEEESLKTALDTICSRSSAIIRSQPWAKDFSIAIASQVVADVAAQETSRLLLASEQELEDRFIRGETEEIPVPEMKSVDLSGRKPEVESVVFDSLVGTVSKFIALASKAVILNGNLQVDATEQVDNNIRISREVSKEVLGNLSGIIGSAYNSGKEHLKSGENSNVEV